MLLYHYPNCDTCRKARKWLDAQGAHYQAVDIVGDPPSVATLARVLELSGRPLKALFNTAGQSYRSGNFKERLAQMSTEEALAALAADGKLIKRPLLLDDHTATIGFSEPAYRDMLRSRA